jgi:hypothetical protein
MRQTNFFRQQTKKFLNKQCQLKTCDRCSRRHHRRRRQRQLHTALPKIEKKKKKKKKRAPDFRHRFRLTNTEQLVQQYRTTSRHKTAQTVRIDERFVFGVIVAGRLVVSDIRYARVPRKQSIETQARHPIKRQQTNKISRLPNCRAYICVCSRAAGARLRSCRESALSRRRRCYRSTSPCCLYVCDDI